MRPAWVPVEEIKFACRTGFISRNIWDRFFAGDFKRSWNFKRWVRLKAEGYFLTHPSAISPDFLVPNPWNSEVMMVGNGIVKPPYVAQLKHDESVYLGLLALERAGLVMEYAIEQELRRGESVVSMGAKMPKLPDLLITMIGGMRLACEVELTQKTKARYVRQFHAYRERRDTDAILFIVPNRGILSSIVSASKASMFPIDRIPIGFMNLEKWRTDTAGAKLSFGEGPTTLLEFCGLNRNES